MKSSNSLQELLTKQQKSLILLWCPVDNKDLSLEQPGASVSSMPL